MRPPSRRGGVKRAGPSAGEIPRKRRAPLAECASTRAGQVDGARVCRLRAAPIGRPAELNFKELINREWPPVPRNRTPTRARNCAPRNERLPRKSGGLRLLPRLLPNSR